MIEKLLGTFKGAWLGAKIALEDFRRKSAWTDYQGFVFSRGLDSDPAYGGSLSRPYAQHPTVYRAIKSFAQNVARIPPDLYRKGSKARLDDTAFHRLLAAPNPLMAGTQLLEALTIDLETFGNGLWLLGPRVAMTSGVLLPASIRRMDPRFTTVKLDDNGAPLRYEFSRAGKLKTFPAEDVVHFKYWNPYDESWGLSWTDASRSEFDTDWMAQQWNRSFLERGAVPGGVLQMGDKYSADEDQAERIRVRWNQRHGGLWNAHAVAVVPRGFEYKSTGIGQKDMEFSAQRRYSRENMLSASGVPPSVAGILEYANYANMAPQLRIFFHLELAPRLMYIQSVMQSRLIDPMGGNFELRFRMEEISALLDETEQKTQVAERCFKMGVPLEQLNERFDLGLDLAGVESAGVSFIQTGVTEYGVQPAAAAPVTAPQDQPGTPGASGPDAAPQSQALPHVVPFASKRGRMTSQLREAIWRKLDRGVRDLELKAESRWRSYLNGLQTQVLAKLTQRAAASLTEFPRKEQEFDEQDADQEAILALEPIWRASMNRGADLVSEETGIAIDFSLIDPRVIEALANRRQIIRGVNDRIGSDLRELLSEGVQAGETERQLKQRVLDFFAGERANARTVARTETFSSFSEGRYMAMEQAGVGRTMWITARDDRVRDSHDALDGEEVMLGDTFDNGLQYPLDPSGPPEEVINCRCVTVAV